MEVTQTMLTHVADHGWHGLLAYIDPSTGSLIFQAAAASLISAGLFVKGLRSRLIWLFTAGWRNRFPSTVASPPENPLETSTEAWSREKLKDAA